MGFAQVAVAAILFVGFLAGVSSINQAYETSAESLRAAVDDSQERGRVLRQGDLQIDNVSFNAGPQEAWINVTNTGEVSFNITGLDVLLDGIVSTTVTSMTVDGVSTNIWPPAGQLLIRVPATSSPGNVAVAAPSGAMAFWRA